MADEPRTLRQLEVAKLNIFSDNEGGDVDLSLSIIDWKNDKRAFLRVEITAACAWFGFDLEIEEAETFAEQIQIGLLALRGALAEKNKKPKTTEESDRG